MGSNHIENKFMLMVNKQLLQKTECNFNHTLYQLERVNCER